MTHLQLPELDPNEPAQHQRQKRERHLAIDAFVSLDHRTMSNHMANTEPTLGTKALASTSLLMYILQFNYICQQ